MPIAITFEEPSTFVALVSGDITFTEVEVALEGLKMHPRLRPGVRILADCRQVTGVPTTSEMRTIARDMRPLLAKGATSLALVTDNPWLYGVAQMFSVFAEAVGVKIATFRDMQEARTWQATASEGSKP